MRSAASCGHPLQEIAAPLGALTWRLRMLMVETKGSQLTPKRTGDDRRASKASNLKTYAASCQFEIEKFLT
jgi:hypothetical protein